MYPAEREALSQKLVSRLQKELEPQLTQNSSVTVGLFRPHSGEPDLDALADWLADQGVLTAYPRVVDRTRGEMEFRRARASMPSSWSKGAFGLLEPTLMSAPVSAEDLRIVLVPGLAFGLDGERVGHGLGFYDRFLARAPKALRVGVCWDFQLGVDGMEIGAHDQKMDWVATESRTIRVPRTEVMG